ncbi:bifunctional metallophosphatase/5'-nucleotidase [Candidatus Riflebacteria bacterium]
MERQKAIFFLLFFIGGVFFYSISHLRSLYEIKTDDIDLVLIGLEQGEYMPQAKPSGKKLGGMAYLAGQLKLLKEESEKGNRGFLLFSLGDTLFGDPYTNFTRGKFMIELLNSLGLNGILLGNLEFSYPQAIVRRRIKEATFPVFASNIFTISGDYLPATIPFKTYKVKGYKIGIVGFAPLDGNTVILKDNIANLEFRSVSFALNKLKQQLNNAGCDFVFALSQINDTEFNKEHIEDLRESGIGAIVKIVYTRRFEVIENHENLDAVNFFGLNRGKYLTRVRLKFNPKTKKIYKIEGQKIPVVVTNKSFDREIGKKINLYNKKIQSILDIPVGKAKIRIPKVADPKKDANNQESPLGNLITDIVKKYCKSDLVFINSGALRDEFSKGTIVNEDIFRCLPFNDDLFVSSMDGYIVESALETGASSRYGFLQVSGLSYTIDFTKMEGERIKDIYVNGKELNRSKKYSIAISSFLKGGGDGFVEFSRLESYKKMPKKIQQIVREYIRHNSPISAKLENRITFYGPDRQ